LESELNDSNYNSSTTATKDTSNKFSSRSAGRWTKEEHQKFVEGLRKYGKNWKEVEAFVGTRNGAQIRSHAQKFFNRLEREYSVKLNNGKPQNAKKKGKESIRKISDSSISTYNSSHENMSDDSKSIDFSKEEMTKIEKVNIITKEPEIIQSIAPVVEKTESTHEQVQDLIKDVLIICQKRGETLPMDNTSSTPFSSYSFYDLILSKINKVDSNIDFKFPKLSDLVAMPRDQRHLITVDNVQHKSTPSNISCSFQVFASRSTQDQNTNTKLKPLRRGVMLDDVVTKKLKAE